MTVLKQVQRYVQTSEKGLKRFIDGAEHHYFWVSEIKEELVVPIEKHSISNI